MATRRTHAVQSSRSAVTAAERALAEVDHSRLPAWMVARIAVESAQSVWAADYDRDVVAPMRAELEALRQR